MIHYLDVNSQGDMIVLFLHGLGADADSWSYQIQGLASSGYRLIALDLPGFGNSPANGMKWSIHVVADQIIELMDELNIQKFIVTGISLGGVISIELASKYPERVQGTILVNTLASLKPKSLSEWAYFIRRGFRVFLKNPAKQAAIVAERVFPRDDQGIFREILMKSIQKADPRAYRQAMLELARINIEKNLTKIRKPVLVISGAEDTTIPLKSQTRLAWMIPGAEHIIIPRAGHAVSADQPEMFNACLRDFIEKIRIDRLSHPVTL